MKVRTVYRSRLKAIGTATPQAAKNALLQTGADILNIANQFVPVDTGSLKKSGGVVPVSSDKVHVGYGGPGKYYENREPAKYAAYVEYGTSQSPAQPYLRPAFQQAEPTFKKRLEEEIEKLI